MGLFWDLPELYADLEFYGDGRDGAGRITYFIRRPQSDQHRGVVRFDGRTVPLCLERFCRRRSFDFTNGRLPRPARRHGRRRPPPSGCARATFCFMKLS